MSQMRSGASALSLESSRWRLAGYKGNGPANFITGAETAAEYAGQQLSGEDACDWWLDRLRLWLEHRSGNLEVLDAAFWPGHDQGEQQPPEALRLGKYFTIFHVFLSSADYCLEWAKLAPKEQPTHRADAEDQTAALSQTVKTLIQEGLLTESRKKRGRKARSKVPLRKKIVRKHINHKRDFYDPEIFHALLSDLDYDQIPPPIALGKPIFDHPWSEVQDDCFLKGRVIKILNEDRWD